MFKDDSDVSADGEEMKDFDNSTSSCLIDHNYSHDWTRAILKTVLVNGTIKVLGQIDHGSSDCLMRESVVKDGGWFAESGNRTGTIIINSIGGTMYSTKLLYVHLTIDGIGADVVPLLVVPDDALPYPLMVGRSWMEQRGIGYVRDEKELRFFYSIKSQQSIHKSIVSDRVFRKRNLKFSSASTMACYVERILADSFDPLHRLQGRSNDRIREKGENLQTSWRNQ